MCVMIHVERRNSHLVCSCTKFISVRRLERYSHNFSRSLSCLELQLSCHGLSLLIASLSVALIFLKTHYSYDSFQNVWLYENNACFLKPFTSTTLGVNYELDHC